MLRSVNFVQVADWFIAYVVRKHPDKESLRQRWMQDSDPWAARAGWSLTSDRIAKDPEGLDLAALLDRIETEMGSVAPEVQWTMNFCLAGIGIHFPEHRDRADAIGESWAFTVTIRFPKAAPRRLLPSDQRNGAAPKRRAIKAPLAKAANPAYVAENVLEAVSGSCLTMRLINM